MVESWVDFISNIGNAWRTSLRTSENMVGTFLEGKSHCVKELKKKQCTNKINILLVKPCAFHPSISHGIS